MSCDRCGLPSSTPRCAPCTMRTPAPKESMPIPLTKEQRTRLRRAEQVVLDRERALTVERDKLALAIEELTDMKDWADRALGHLRDAREALSELT